MTPGEWRQVSASAIALLSLATAGCHSTAPEADLPENRFLRTDTLAPGQVTAAQVPDLLPLHTGDWWELAVQRPQKLPVIEQGAVVGPQSVSEKSGMQIDYRENGKVSRRETFHVGADGIYFLGSGVEQTVVLSPALPVLTVPMTEGATLTWEGLLQFAQSTAPGRSFSRLTVREPVTTPAGKFTCWRVDTTLETNIGGRNVAQLDTRWFAPGVGVVKQETRSGANLTLRTLTAYKVGSKSGGRRVQAE